MKIFVVGGAGYIGSHMVKLAFLKGYDVVTIDNLSTGHRDAVKYGKFEKCDIRDTEKLNKLFLKYKPELILHFAAFSIVSESINEPYKYYNNNVLGTLNLLKVMIDNNCKKIIFSSTAAVFGIPNYLPIDEKHIKNPINPYGKSKLMIEEILKDFEKSYGLRYVILRYFNACGHDKDGELIENHNPETHLIPLIMETVFGKRDSINIYGIDYDTKDGTCIRDYIHVEDLCEAHLKSIIYLDDIKNESIDFNLGNSKGFSVLKVIETIKKITNTDFEVKKCDPREGDPAVLIASNKKSKEILGFVIKYDTMESIIQTVINCKN